MHKVKPPEKDLGELVKLLIRILVIGGVILAGTCNKANGVEIDNASREYNTISYQDNLSIYHPRYSPSAYQ